MLANNRYYLNVRINVDAIVLLLEDGNLNGLHSDSTIDDPEPLSVQNEDPYDAYLSASFVPSTTQRMTEQETVRQSVQERQPHQPPTVSWPPRHGATPINEFNTEDYISCAFPTLFPTGAADFVAPQPLAVTVGNYFIHLLMYAGGRFARHPRFRYFALNTEMCWRALQAGWIYFHQHPHDAQLFFFDCVNMVVIHQYYLCSSITSTETLVYTIFVLQSQALRRNVYTIFVLQSQALRRNVYIGMFAQARPPMRSPSFNCVVKQLRFWRFKVDFEIKD